MAGYELKEIKKPRRQISKDVERGDEISAEIYPTSNSSIPCFGYNFVCL